jgi:hypothetical protein
MSWENKVGKGKAFDVANLVKWLGEVEEKRGTAPYTEESRVHQKIKCGRKDCTCTHDWPCEAGWVEVENPADPKSNGQVKPCRYCRGDVAAIAQQSADRQDFQATIRDKEKREQAASDHAWDD